MPALNEHMLLKVCAYITDPVTTTDELIPSGETGSFRSNPMGLAEFTLSRRVPEYVGKAKAVMNHEKTRKNGTCPAEVAEAIAKIRTIPGFAEIKEEKIDLSSTIYAVKPGDGSARGSRWMGKHCKGVRYKEIQIKPYQLGYGSFRDRQRAGLCRR